MADDLASELRNVNEKFSTGFYDDVPQLQFDVVDHDQEDRLEDYREDVGANDSALKVFEIRQRYVKQGCEEEEKYADEACRCQPKPDCSIHGF